MKIGGQIPWNPKLIFETFKISYLIGRPNMRDVLGLVFKGFLGGRRGEGRSLGFLQGFQGF